MNRSLDNTDKFVALFREHARAIYAHIRTLVPNEHDADEVFQETSSVLWQKFDQYRPDTDFRAWSCRIAYYKVLKLREQQYRAPRLFSSEFLEVVDEELIVKSDVLDARSEALAECREKLNQRDRDLLERYYEKGMAAKDIAKQIKRSTHYVYRALRRIHDVLYDCVTKTLADEADK